MSSGTILKIDSVAWFSCLQLRQASIGAQGLYVNLLALAAASPDSNVILRASKKPMESSDIAHLLGVHQIVYQGLLQELIRAAVIHKREDGAICLARIDVPSSAVVRRRKPSARVATVETEELFSQFWEIYPKKKAREAARRAFFRLAQQGLASKIIDGLRLQLPELMHRDPTYRPYPATWLNSWRWEDQADQPAVSNEVEYRKW